MKRLLTGAASILFVLAALLNSDIAAGQAVRNDSTAYINGVGSIDEYLPLLKGKKVAMAINHSSLINGRRSVDVIKARQVKITKIFSPEHGAYGKISANTKVDSQLDPATGIPVISLFGEKQKPSPGDLKDVDIVVFDMQDVGVRFYTYISTLHYVMEACAEKKIPVIVLDRANPNDGYIDGPVLDLKYRSFIGMHPVPIVYGMTIGEYAQMVNGEGWLAKGIKADLTVIKVKNYFHGKPFRYEQAPSPNLNTNESIYLYPSLCWFGATAISDGRGTFEPYLQIGHPKFSNSYTHRFLPQPVNGMNENPKHKGDTCYGLDLRQVSPAMFGVGGQLNLSWLIEMYERFEEKDRFFNGEIDQNKNAILHFDQLAGGNELRRLIHEKRSVTEIRESWKAGLNKFRQLRKKYLLYPDVPSTLKLMTYNIHHGYDAAEKDRLNNMAAVLAAIGPDIVALQEVDSVCERSGDHHQARRLAEANGYYYHFSRHFALGHGAYGNAILSRFPFEEIRDYRLPVLGKQDGVVFQTVVIRLPDGNKLTVANVHMDYRDKDSRIKQSLLINDMLKNAVQPVVLMGDFNVQPGDAVLDNYNTRFKLATNSADLTFPAEKPDRTIDYICTSPDLLSLATYTFPVTHSDHLPLVAVIQGADRKVNSPDNKKE